MKEENLWNEIKNKTRKVREYISDLEPMYKFNDNQEKHFQKIKSKALLATTPNEALELIKYNYNKRCGLYRECLDLE